jgi:transcriptional regulator with XRE-family HTH domain
MLEMNLQLAASTWAPRMNPTQCRMARAALGIGVRELAALADVAVSTVSRFEAGQNVHTRSVDSMRDALEKGGVEFTNDDQPGVKLRKKGRRK